MKYITDLVLIRDYAYQNDSKWILFLSSLMKIWFITK
jgi:hypothetical protein